MLRSVGIEDEWRIFYDRVKGEVWPQEFAAVAAQSERFQAWNRHLARLRSLADPDAWRLVAGRAEAEKGQRSE